MQTDTTQDREKYPHRNEHGTEPPRSPRRALRSPRRHQEPPPAPRWRERRSPALQVALGAGLVLAGIACTRLLGPGFPGGPDARAAKPTATAAPLAPPRTIHVDGQARLEVPPNRVDLSLVLTSRKPTPRAAAQDVRRRQAILVRALGRMGVRGDDLVIAGLTLHPQYRPYPGRGIEAYAANVTLVASVHDFDKVADVLEAATGEVERVYASYHHSKLHEMKNRARSMALKAARRKAEQIAREMGVTLGPVQLVEEDRSGTHGRQWWNPGVDNEVNFVARAGRGAGASGQQAQLIHLRLSIRARFSIL